MTPREFLTLVWPQDLMPSETLELRAIDRKNKKIRRRWCKTVDEFLQATTLFPGHDIYFGVCTRFQHGGTKNECFRVNCVWVDIDKSKILPEFKIKPDIIINSGRGYHIYWLLKDSVFVRTGRWEEIEAVNRALAEMYGGDMMAVDITRILRVPGTLNYKFDPPKEVTFNAI